MEEQTQTQEMVDYTENFNALEQKINNIYTENQGFYDYISQRDTILDERYVKYLEQQEQYNKLFFDENTSLTISIKNIEENLITKQEFEQFTQNLDSTTQILDKLSNADYTEALKLFDNLTNIFSTIHFSVGILFGSLLGLALIFGFNQKV